MAHIHKVFVVGGTGHLGHAIVHELHHEGFEVHVAVRPGTPAEKLSHFKEDKHLKIVEVDLSNKEQVIAKTNGLDAIVSALAGDDKVFVGLQTILLEAAKANNHKLFIPSEYGANYDVLAPNFGYLGFKAMMKETIKKSGVPTTIICCGNFYEYAFTPAFHFDWENGKVIVLGDGNTKIARTKITDVAKTIAHALKTPNHPAHVLVAGDIMSELDAVHAFEEATGRKFEVTHKTTEEFLKASEAATDFFPGKFSNWLHAFSDKIAVFTPNVQIHGATSIKDYAHHVTHQKKQ